MALVVCHRMERFVYLPFRASQKTMPSHVRPRLILSHCCRNTKYPGLSLAMESMKVGVSISVILEHCDPM
jgi:hypothetical protein